MGLFSKLFKGPEPDMEKSAANAKKVRALFDQAVDHGEEYRLIVGYTEDVQRFNYGFVHGSKTQIGNLDRGLERNCQYHCGGANRSGPLWLRRPHLLPPR